MQTMPKRVFVSVPRDHNLNEGQLALKTAILERIQRSNLAPQEFQVSGLAKREAYTLDAIGKIMTRCHGALILAFARWHDPAGDGALSIPTVWNHFEGAFAVAMKKEILVITEEHVAQDGITWGGNGQITLRAPQDATPAWLDSEDTARQFDAWVEAVHKKHHIFLAYSSKARATANDVNAFVTSQGVSVRNWELDFAAGGTILSELLEATQHCIGAIVLLTKDDELVQGGEHQAAPRDNVIFEMGMFMEAKGRERVLVIRESGTKMPADIGGGIYLSLSDRSDITPLHSKLLQFLERRI